MERTSGGASRSKELNPPAPVSETNDSSTIESIPGGPTIGNSICSECIIADFLVTGSAVYASNEPVALEAFADDAHRLCPTKSSHNPTTKPSSKVIMIIYMKLLMMMK